MAKVVDSVTTAVTTGSGYSLTNGQTYTMQIVIDDDPNTSGLRRLG